jgi:hypothetical protein
MWMMQMSGALCAGMAYVLCKCVEKTPLSPMMRHRAALRVDLMTSRNMRKEPMHADRRQVQAKRRTRFSLEFSSRSLARLLEARAH